MKDKNIQINQDQESHSNLLYETFNVCKSFGKGSGKVNALSNINIKINKQELTIIDGASGSGKSTLLNVLACIIKPESGSLNFDGNDVTNLSLKQQLTYRREKIGYIYQNYNLIPGLNIIENVRVASYLVPEPLDEMEVLDVVGLAEKAKSFPHELSGGQQQRACIARALVKSPEVLLCDEPTGALDTENSNKVIKMIQSLIQNNGVSVVMITHNPEIAKIGDHCITISNGKIINDVRE